MTVVLEKKMQETDPLTGFLAYVDTYAADLFEVQQFQTQPASDSYVVECRLSALKQLADHLRKLHPQP